MGVRKIRFIIFEIIPKWQTSIKDCHCAFAERMKSTFIVIFAERMKRDCHCAVAEKYKRLSLQPSPKEWNVEELHCAVAERMKV